MAPVPEVVEEGWKWKGLHQASDGRRRLLLVTYYFPPVRTVACCRSWNIANQLARLGWEVIVLTPDSSYHRFVDATGPGADHWENPRVRRLRTGHGARLLLPLEGRRALGKWISRFCRRAVSYLGIEPSRGWLRMAVRAARSLTPADVDVVMGTGPPFEAFHAARSIARTLRRPYVLDYRDPWMGNPHTRRPLWRMAVRAERRLIAGAAAMTIVSDSWAAQLVRMYGTEGKTHVIPNGYDEDLLKRIEPERFSEFAIVYTGIFYPPKRVISPIFAALRRLAGEGERRLPSWQFHYYGPHGSHVVGEAARFELRDNVQVHGCVEHKRALAAVAGANVAVVITTTGRECGLADRGVVPGKLYEALGLGTPILLIAPPRADARGIVRGYSGVCVAAGDEVQVAASFLGQCMARPRQREEYPRREYSWPRIAQRLGSVLAGAVASSDATRFEGDMVQSAAGLG